MEAAINRALDKLSVASPPRVLSYNNESVAFHEHDHELRRSGVIRWDLKHCKPDEVQFSRLGLTNRRSVGDVALPCVSDDLSKLLESGDFATQQFQPHKSGTPDVVVIDDLGLRFSNLKFELFEDCPLKQKQRFQQAYNSKKTPLRNKAKRALKRFENAPNADNDESRKKREGLFGLLQSSREELMKTELSALFSRLSAKARKVGDTGREYPVEPIIVISAASQLPQLSAAISQSGGTERNLWEHIFGNNALRRRTVVLLNVADLRNEISISSGLSWERTVQDTIIELNRHPSYRQILNFGHVVIRFGLTGTLLIRNEGGRQHSYTLYFNPDQSDSMWNHPNDGIVLGETAMLAASIVERLTERCMWRRGAAILPDLSDAVDHALSLAIQRLLTHFELGYGKHEVDLKLRRTLQWFDKQVFSSGADALEPEFNAKLTPISVQRVQLAPFRSKHWSILLQSCQTDLNNVARNIVKFGPKVVLNTLRNSVEIFVERLILELQENLDDNDHHDHRFSWYDPESIRLQGETKTLSRMEARRQLLRNIRFLLSKVKEEPRRSTIRRLFGPSIAEGIQKAENCLLGRRETHFEYEAYEGLSNALNELSGRGKLFFRLVESARQPLSDSEFEDTLKQQFEKAFDIILSSDGSSGDKTKFEAYEILRDQVQNSKHWLDGFREKGRIGKLFEQIENGGLADPIRFLHQSLVEFIASMLDSDYHRAFSSPILRVGKHPSRNEPDLRLTVIDRKEVESIRAVKRMIENYLTEKKPERPLSIAVFGPPGAGKSVAVKMVIQMVKQKNPAYNIEEITVNLSELSGVDSLKQRLSDLSRDSIPFIFFDEFDSALNNEQNGWLKYFLPPMEDGDRFVARAVFVFAGGMSKSFEEFSLADSSRSDEDWVRFVQAKGPDFVSRLRGHINVVGVNSAGQDDDLYLIRRALALRFQLDQKQQLGDCGVAKIDEFLLNAFLHVPEYRHGARSMRMLLDLCTNMNGERIAMSEVPPIHQLNMQVDGRAFAELASGQKKPVL